MGSDSCDYLGSLYGLDFQTQNIRISAFRDMVNSYPNAKLVEQPALGTGAFYIYAQGPTIGQGHTQGEICLVFAPVKSGVAQVGVGVDNKPATGENAICGVAVTAFKKLFAK